MHGFGFEPHSLASSHPRARCLYPCLLRNDMYKSLQIKDYGLFCGINLFLCHRLIQIVLIQV